ncbi:hypothetical protein DM01DRAFT_1385993 [Hesseltinella vesiculosa]|uniref:Uncharacterized protein n=1 Tax=Hesseltinella vesiculosa TaxID=101127 RepID=A0A1X2G8C3_9FUNG|nr:hypothetical protein DM01DRAFT_1385993 [Hesseltinella vesiculosa]
MKPQYLNRTWTDRALMSICISSPRQDTGSGQWRLNISLLQSKTFQDLLKKVLELCFELAPEEGGHDQKNTPQQQWERIKSLMQAVAKNSSPLVRSQRNQQHKRLQRKHEILVHEASTDPNKELRGTLEQTRKKLDELQ